MRMARVCRGRVENLAERTEHAQVFVNPDGSRTLDETVEPARVRDGKNWIPVDTRLRATAAGIAPKATVLPMVFSAGGDTLVGRLGDRDRELTVTWPEKLPKPALAGSTALYKGVLPGVDLRVTAQATGFSEVLVVHDRKAAANPKLAKLKFGMSAKGVKVKAATGGGLVARDAKGAAVFTAPAPLMWDSTESSSPSSPAEQSRPDITAEGEAKRRAVMPLRVTGSAITVTPDRAMLTDPRTRYPVYIDPAVTGGLVDNEWTSVWSKYPSSSFWKNTTALTDGAARGSAGAGRTEDCSGCSDHIIRSLFRMDTSKVKATQILGAQFRIEQRWSWTCSPVTNAKLWLTGGFSKTTTWNSQPTWNNSYTAQTKGDRKVGGVHGCYGPGTIEFDVKSMVALGASKNWTSVSVGLRAVDEGTLSQWKRYNPSTAKLSVTYNRAPNAATNRIADTKACATGSGRPYVLSPTPTLAAMQSDPDTDEQSLTTDFYWWQYGGARSESNKVSQTNGNNASVAKAVPAGKLADGTTYVWQTKTSDGNLSTWSGTCEFTVDATPPAKPGGVTSTDYPSGVFRGGVGIPGTFTITPPGSTEHPEEVVSYAWTLDSGQQLAAPTVPAASNYGATITVTPQHDGLNVLHVWSKDRAGRLSALSRDYSFSVNAGTGPAARWTFEEATGTSTAADISQHNNTLTLAGGATRVAGRGNEGSALWVNGSTGYATTASAPTYPHPDTGAATAVRTDSSFTVSAWVKIDSVDNPVQSTAVGAAGNATYAYALGFAGHLKKWRFYITASDTENAAVYQVYSDALSVANKWTHLTGVYNGTTRTMTLYVNGVRQAGSATVTAGTGFNATGPVLVGKHMWHDGNEAYFNGAIDDVRIYNFIETDANIATLALPLKPQLSLPNGPEIVAGGTVAVTFDARGDTNVTKFKYSLDNSTLDLMVNAIEPGGTATVNLPVGTFTGERTVFAVAVDAGGRTGPKAQIQLRVKPATSVTGVVLDTTWLPAPGAVVKLQPGGYTATADANGAFGFANIPIDFYTITATYGGRCGLVSDQQLLIDGEGMIVQILLMRAGSNLGHVCAENTTTFSAAATTLALTGDDAVATVNLPFAFPFYGGAYRTAWVDTNGLLSFVDPQGSHPHTAGTPLVSGADPNAVIAPFWDDLVVDASASVRTSVVGSGATQRFLIEWRNVYRKGNTGQRLSFEVLLSPDGTVTTNYDGLDNAAERGANALVGIESSDGEDGFAYSTEEASLVSGKALVFTPPEVTGSFETHTLSGTLTNAAGAAVGGATVTLDPSGMTTTTAANGSYAFDGAVADSYTVSASLPGRCAITVADQVELLADTVHDLHAGPNYGEMGYACSTGASGYVAAGTVLPLTDDWVSTTVTAPFPVRLHGASSSTLTVYDDGFVQVAGGTVAPFWDDFWIDGSASVRTQAAGTAPNRTFTVEWRNVLFVDTDERVTFEAVFHENGSYAFHYGAMTSARQRGSAASVGLKSPDGWSWELYSYQEAALTANSSITYTPAPAGVVRGVLTEGWTTEPVAGATITMNPGGRSTVTGADGSYQFANTPVGAYTLAVNTGTDGCTGQYATATGYKSSGDLSVDLSVSPKNDDFYTCTVGTQGVIPGDTVRDWTGDDAVWQVPVPFPIKLYGEVNTTSAWIGSNGFISFAPTSPWSYPDSEIPSGTWAPASPNNVVFPFFDDLDIDNDAAMLTKISGTAPNRQWIVEWRNAKIWGGDNERVTFEVIFTENGGVTFAYDDIDPLADLERGARAAVGVEGAAGVGGFQYLFRAPQLATGRSITFTADAPATNTIEGRVTCGDDPVEGATVKAAGLSVTSDENGWYELVGVPAKTWNVVATIPSGDCAYSMAWPALVGRDTVAMNWPAEPGDGYRIAEQAVPYTALSGTSLFGGHDQQSTLTLPFPITLYGTANTSALVFTGGYLDFGSGYVAPFSGDWEADENSTILTGVRGTAPNRQYVVEWRNVRPYNDDGSTRVTFQAIFDETGGGISFAYPTNDGTFIRSGGAARIGIAPKDDTSELIWSDQLGVLRPGYGLRLQPSHS
ncbi:hypothetical protein Ato02nite_025030 [Paractinoplanes toevensis]|uniref:LamG-like jellyroll fold domain-containing protein n=1 Tax=Paractinoplanes toevensis TaxID=571911 RepID=A0A919W3N3_9ACTN|nr:hypothetical protein Ato02nite_025030 [Actinoplanes toevensis]